MSTLLYKDLSRMSFFEALRFQEKLVGLKRNSGDADVILFVEHPHVYTLGRGGKADHVLAPHGVPVYRTDRGGDVTYHGPGQLVVYPIVDLRSKLRKAVHQYLRNLEQSALATLADFGISAIRRPPYTGIWIGDKKIAAIGIAVRRAITYHGLALNVNVDLSYFRRIIPCGLSWADVTSMAQELGAEPSLSAVRQAFLHHFAAIFGYSELRECELDGNALTDKCGISAAPEKLETRNPELEITR
jgi:lipoate-protein ligase B